MKYKYLLFDLDGTIFDYDGAESGALEKTFEYFGLTYSDSFLKEYRKINKQIWQDYELGHISQEKLRTERFRRLGISLGINFDLKDISLIYLKNLSSQRYLLPGTLSLLEDLSERSFKMYLITNGLKDVQRSRLSESEITRYFTDIFISEEIGFAKPDQAIFNEVFKRMSYPDKRSVLIIGDSLTSDIAGGNNSGIDTCWFNPDKLNNNTKIFPTYELTNICDLIRILM